MQDYLQAANGEVTPLEIKSGKDYKRHSALNNVLGNEEYEIQRAYILSERNVEVDGKKIYIPIYMIMFFENTEIDKLVYKLDLSVM